MTSLLKVVTDLPEKQTGRREYEIPYWSMVMEAYFDCYVACTLDVVIFDTQKKKSSSALCGWRLLTASQWVSIASCPSVAKNLSEIQILIKIWRN